MGVNEIRRKLFEPKNFVAIGLHVDLQENHPHAPPDLLLIVAKLTQT